LRRFKLYQTKKIRTQFYTALLFNVHDELWREMLLELPSLLIKIHAFHSFSIYIHLHFLRNSETDSCFVT